MAEPTNHDAGGLALLKNRLPVAEEHAPSTDEAVATDIPSANAPDPTAANPEVNPNAAGDKPSDAVSDVDESAQTKPPAKSCTPKVISLQLRQQVISLQLRLKHLRQKRRNTGS